MNTELEIMAGRNKSLRAKMKSLKDVVYTMKQQYSTALQIVTDIRTGAATLTTWADQAVRAYNERPLEIARFTGEWKATKEELRSLESLLLKYNYLLPNSVRRTLGQQLQLARDSRAKAKVLKQAYESPLSKVLCRPFLNSFVAYIYQLPFV